MGGPGDDVLIGGNGQDSYRFAEGDGNDVIRDIPTLVNSAGGGSNRLFAFGGQSNLIEFAAGIDPASVTVELVPTDATGVSGDWPSVAASYLVRYGSAGDTILLEDYVTHGATLAENLPGFRFADGSLQPFHFNGTTGAGTSGADYVKGTAGADAIETFDGDDVIYGYFYNNFLGLGTLPADADVIDAGAGADRVFAVGTLAGGAGDDWLEGAGTLAGGTGNDTLVARGETRFVVEADGGSDLIRNLAGGGVVEFGAGIAHPPVPWPCPLPSGKDDDRELVSSLTFGRILSPEGGLMFPGSGVPFATLGKHDEPEAWPPSSQLVLAVTNPTSHGRPEAPLLRRVLAPFTARRHVMFDHTSSRPLRRIPLKQPQ